MILNFPLLCSKTFKYQRKYTSSRNEIPDISQSRKKKALHRSSAVGTQATASNQSDKDKKKSWSEVRYVGLDRVDISSPLTTQTVDPYAYGDYACEGKSKIIHLKSNFYEGPMKPSFPNVDASTSSSIRGLLLLFQHFSHKMSKKFSRNSDQSRERLIKINH